ncbi:MAG: DNA primase [Spirochaetales bacterium]|nr:DNA primase [Spirochaetales bacterium]
MAKISERIIEEIKSRISLTDLISQYITVERKGDRYWALCPFHEEKTPSFSFVPDRGFFHCFGCGKSGSIFDFVMEMEHLNFPEAVRYLAEKVGIEIEEESPEERKKRDELNSMRSLYDKIAASFNYILNNSSYAQGAREYLKRRGFTEETINHYQVGYAPDDPAWLYTFLKEREFSDPFLKQSGLFSRNNVEYPLFRNRLMFPIRDWQGRVVAFGGRDLSGTSKAKYINTPETLLYSKREVLYGLHEGLDSIKREGSVILSEGYFDVLALHQAGLKNSVAPLGTAFTPEQGRLIRRYAEKVLFLFDGDLAGLNATKKALIVAENGGLQSRVIVLEGAEDPAELLEKGGGEPLLQQCKETQSGFDYLVHSAINRYDAEQANGKLQIFNEVKPYLDAVDSNIVRMSYLRDLASYLQLDEETLLLDYVERSKGGSKRPQEERRNSGGGAKRSTDLYLMLTVMNNRSLFPSIRKRLPLDALKDERAIELYNLLEETSRVVTGESDEFILQRIDDSELRNLVATSFISGEFRSQGELIANTTLQTIILRHLRKRQKRVENLLHLAERDGQGGQELADLLHEKKSLDEEIANYEDASVW